MLRSFAIRYDPVEDRLVLRITAQHGDGTVDHWLQLTRRVCARWRQHLQTMVDASAELPAQLPPAARPAMSAAHHQAMAAQAPLRSEPIEQPPASGMALITRVACGRRRSDGRWLLQFELRDAPSISLALSARTLHGLIELLSKRVQGAGWDLPAMPLERPEPAAPGGALH